MKFYTLNNKFIKESQLVPDNFTGIIKGDIGTKLWCLKGKWHRIDGPAIEYADGTKSWHINNKKVAEEQHALFRDLMKLKGLL